MSAFNNIPESTEAPNQLITNLLPVPLKYIPLPAPLPSLNTPITIVASDGMRPPCRRCLLDASPGEELHLIAYDPFPVDSVTPYRGTGPIFIHAYDCGLFDGDVLPERQLRRQMSIRAYDQSHMLMAAETVDGTELEKVAGGIRDGRRRRLYGWDGARKRGAVPSRHASGKMHERDGDGRPSTAVDGFPAPTQRFRGEIVSNLTKFLL